MPELPPWLQESAEVIESELELDRKPGDYFASVSPAIAAELLAHVKELRAAATTAIESGNVADLVAVMDDEEPPEVK